jgi:DNA-binding Xre family transcriptional regulator
VIVTLNCGSLLCDQEDGNRLGAEAEDGRARTTDLVPLLTERGIHLSREQVYRLVTQPPQRLSMDTLAALCDILGCTPNDLIKVEVANAQVRKTAEGTPTPPPPVRRSTIRHPDST